jgi:anti-anti-sigma regulatory factor
LPGEEGLTKLKITVHEEPDAMTLTIEGKVVGPWSNELDQAWRSVAASRGSKRLIVDLCGVTHMDRDARRILADIHRDTGAQFVANSPMTKYFAEEAQLKNPSDRREET